MGISRRVRVCLVPAVATPDSGPGVFYVMREGKRGRDVKRAGNRGIDGVRETQRVEIGSGEIYPLV